MRGKGKSGTCYVRWPQSIRHLFRYRKMGQVEVAETDTLLASQKKGASYSSLGTNDDRKPGTNLLSGWMWMFVCACVIGWAMVQRSQNKSRYCTAMSRIGCDIPEEVMIIRAV